MKLLNRHFFDVNCYVSRRKRVLHFSQLQVDTYVMRLKLLKEISYKIHPHSIGSLWRAL